ncbi:MAG: fibronectin type III domain-containing protein [Acidimicrobiales bacterium]
MVTLIAGIVIGAGFPGGVASAAEVFGQAVEIAPLSGMTDVSISSISCSSSGNCTAVGYYIEGTSQESIGITETGGTWGTMQLFVPPSNQQPDPATAVLSQVSCTSPGNCVAVGDYAVDFVGPMPMEATETNGTWGPMQELSQLPNGAEQEGYLDAVSCPSAGNCVASGFYLNGGLHIAPMVEEETSGSWTQPTQLNLPSNASSEGINEIGVSCATTANCTVVSPYTDNAQNGEILADTETNGSWAPAVEISLPSDADLTDSSDADSMEGISCPAAGSCEAVGTYENSSDETVPMAATESGGIWAQATQVALPSGADLGGFMDFIGFQTISCASIGNCVAGGDYPSANGIPGFTVNETAGIWAQGTVIVPPSNATPAGVVSVNSISCTSDGTCGMGGTYSAGSSNDEAFVDSGEMAPSAPVATASAGDGSADVSWTPSTDATSYSVYSATSPGAENYSGPAVCTTTAPSVECTVSGLTNGTKYYFTVVATNADADSTPSNEVAAEPQATSTYGYTAVASDGGTFSFGDAAYDGSEAGKPLSAPIVGVAAAPNGYWEVGSDGGVFSFGEANFYGSEAGKPLSSPIVGIASTPTGNGYWEVASNGAVYSFGDAIYYGGEAGKHLSAPIVGIAAMPNGEGYWEVASDGAVYSFGDAIYYGGEAGKHLSAPIVGMAAMPNGDGYWLVGSDGGVFSFGHSGFYGSEAGKHLAKPMVGIASSPTGDGYWLVAADGGVFSFGDAQFEGSMGASSLHAPVVGIASPSSHIV